MVLAKSGDMDLIKRIIHSNLRGFVHSTFKRTYNIQCEDGELYTIACNEIDNGPNTLVVHLTTFENINIHLYDEVLAINGRLTIGNEMSISIDQVESWNGNLPAYPTNTKSLKNNLDTMRQYIDIHGTSGGIKGNATTNESPFEREMAKMLKERTDLLMKELLNNRVRSAVPHAISLIGLGQGLTPSGDDFLVGVFTVFHLKGSPLSSFKWFCEEIVKVAKTATNDISHMAMMKAAEGKVRESIVDLLSALLGESEEKVILTLRKVLTIGSSSGTDIALGILAGLDANIKIGGT